VEGVTDNGAQELQGCLNAMTVAVVKYGEARYQAGFRRGILAAERRQGRAAEPPPIPLEAKLRPPVRHDDDHPTPVQPTEWPYAHPKRPTHGG
jgi:hypothetical protein